MKTYYKKYGRKDGHDLCEITLENDHGMSVKILNYGATLERIDFDNKNMIISLDTPDDYSKERNFLGATVGRIAGRVRKGQWKHGSEIWQLPLNDGKNHIHGGLGTDMQAWNFKLAKEANMIAAKLTLFDPDGHNGYPGNLKLMVSYILDNDNTLHYSLELLSDKLTVANPVNHTYFTLGQRAEDLNLQMNADYYVPVDEEGLPDPEKGMEEVAKTAFDFRKTKKISNALRSSDFQIKLRGGIDHPFILNSTNPAATLSSAEYQMTIETNAPALVLYTGNHFDHTGVTENIGQYDGITFEAQFPPAAGTNLDQFVLMPNEPNVRTISWHFEKTD